MRVEIMVEPSGAGATHARLDDTLLAGELRRASDETREPEGA